MVIFFLSSLETIPSFKFPLSPDKLGHVGVFFILTFLCWRAFYHQEKILVFKNRAILMAFLVASAYGFFDELHQRFVPGRFYDVYDFLADATGALLFVVLLWYYRKRKGSQRTFS